MKRTITIPPEAAGKRADVYIAQLFPENSRSYWQKQLLAGYINQNGTALKPSSALAEGEVIIDTPEITHTPLDLPVLYEDEDVIVLNKPTGVLTHAKGALAEEATVADFVRPRMTDGAEGNRPGIVHRLDRDTSGVIIAAKNSEAKSWLQKQFSLRKVKKTYTALVEGHLEPEKAILRLPIERNPKSPQKFRVGAGGKSAETAYEVVGSYPKYTLVELKPLTGRTHQLRVHMAYLKHPIVGDRFYGGEEASRLFLHAKELEITLPSRERRVFSAPLPGDFTQKLSELM